MKAEQMRPLRAESGLKGFVAWLTSGGAEIMATTNEWEILRYRAQGEIHVVYRNKTGRIAASSQSVVDAWVAYTTQKPWRAVPKNKKGISKKRGRMIDALISRDGDACFYCGKELNEDISLEHFVSRTHGGPNHLSNMALAHRACNMAANHLSVVEKVALKEKMRTTPVAQIFEKAESEAA